MTSPPRADHDEPDPAEAELEVLLSRGECAAALDLMELLPAHRRADWSARIWSEVGALRPLRSLVGRLSDTATITRVEGLLAAGFPPMAIPEGEYGELEAQARELARKGLARELAHCHLGLAEVAPRIDWRVAHVEHAAAIAEQLDDPGLTSLVIAYEARLDTFLGEDEDALERIRTAREAGEAADEPRAVAFARMSDAVIHNDPLRLEEGREALAALGLPHTGFGLEPRTG